MARDFALARTPIYDARTGAMNRAWVKHFDEISSSIGGSAGYMSLDPSGATISGSLPSGGNPAVQLTLGSTAYTINGPTVAGGAPNAGDRFTLYVDQDATGNRTFPTFATGSGNFAADFNTQAPILTASTRTVLICTFHGDVWGLDSFRTNASIT